MLMKHVCRRLLCCRCVPAALKARCCCSLRSAGALHAAQTARGLLSLRNNCSPFPLHRYCRVFFLLRYLLSAIAYNAAAVAHITRNDSRSESTVDGGLLPRDARAAHTHSAVCPTGRCLSGCLSVKRRHCIEMAELIELIFSMDTRLPSAYPGVREFGYLQK